MVESPSPSHPHLDADVGSDETHHEVNGGEREREVEGVHLAPLTRQDEACEEWKERAMSESVIPQRLLWHRATGGGSHVVIRNWEEADQSHGVEGKGRVLFWRCLLNTFRKIRRKRRQRGWECARRACLRWMKTYHLQVQV